MIYSCECGWSGKHRDLGRFGQCPKCGKYDQTQIPEDEEEKAMLIRADESDRIMADALERSGANGFCAVYSTRP